MPIKLPAPDAAAQAHSARLAELIRAEIAAHGGALDFARYMELALYAPGLGYYSAGSTKFGAAGDFVTAPELGALFAQCLAQSVARTLEQGGDVLELGPGSGALAAELLLAWERLGTLPARYLLLERSAELRARQQATLLQRCPQLALRCEWLDEPPTEDWGGVLIANEVVDALPVRLFALRDAGLFARAVGVDDTGAFAWREIAADAALRDALQATLGAQLDTLPRPYRSEICTLLPAWFAAVSDRLVQGEAVFFDYGYTRAEYYLPARREGTLTCHYRHRAHDDPLILPGLQDITAWVDFDALAAAARARGWRIDALITQAHFLVRSGLDRMFTAAYARAPDEAARYALSQEAKRLMLPGQMGEAFKLLRLSRGQ